MSVTSASARRQQYLSMLAGGALKFAPSWCRQGPWLCAVKEVHLDSWSDSFFFFLYKRRLCRVGMISTVEITQHADPKRGAKSNYNKSNVLICAAPTDNIPRTEFLYHLHKEEMVVFKKN